VITIYLPLVGANLAKQLGAAGAAKRTDQMGMLLLISPPGYGKTTLMEYVAARLCLVFIKVNGPALGHQVTSLDPEEAPNATARQEIEKVGSSRCATRSARSSACGAAGRGRTTCAARSSAW
jgi:hypothetical protein